MNEHITREIQEFFPHRIELSLTELAADEFGSNVDIAKNHILI